MNVVIGISDMRVSRDPGEVLVTFALGSCVGLSLYDPVTRTGGLIHSMLPLSKMDAAKAEKNPCMFVDSGVMLLIQTLFDLGVEKKNIVAKIAGGSKIMDEKGIFNIGERNHTVLRKVLWKNNILVSGEDVGGCQARTMYLNMETGRTTLKMAGQEKEL